MEWRDTEIQCLGMVSAGLMSYCGYMLGHHSVLGPRVRTARFAVDSETAMELKFASQCDLNYLIAPKTTADARSSSSLWPCIKACANIELSLSGQDQ